MNENTKIMLLLLLAGVILLSPYALRTFEGNPYTINSETYYNIRVSTDDSIQDRIMPFSLLDFLDLQNIFINKIIPTIFGILCIGFCLMIMKKNNISENNVTTTALILITSPIFIYSFLDFKYFSFAIVLCLITIYLISLKKYYLASIPFMLIPFIDFYSSLVVALLVFLFVLLTSKNYKQYMVLLVLGIVAIIGAVWLNVHNGHEIFRLPFEGPKVITDINGQAGFSFSSIILTLIGVILLWEKGLKNIAFYLFIIGIFILSIYSTPLKAYLNFLLVIYAGFAFIYLNKRKWSIPIIKKITLLLIICSIMFSTILYVTKLSKSSPNPEYVDALEFIKDQSLEREKVLSSSENGYIIEYYTQRPAFIDDKSNIYEPERMTILKNLTLSRNLERTESMLKEYNIKYIFIDTPFRQILEADEGLLFLLENSNKFENIYKNKEVEVWIYTG